MNCRQFKKWMEKDPSAWLPNVKHTLDEHQKSCGSCHALWVYFQGFEETIPDCRNLKIPETVNTNLWPEVFSKINKSPVSRQKTFRPWFHPRIAWSLSTAAAVCLCLIWMLVGKQHHLKSNPDLIVDAATIDGRNAQIMTFQFDDPKLSVIWMEQTEDLP